MMILTLCEVCAPKGVKDNPMLGQLVVCDNCDRCLFPLKRFDLENILVMARSLSDMKERMENIERAMRSKRS